MKLEPGFSITPAGAAYLALQPNLDLIGKLLAQFRRAAIHLPEAAQPEPARAILLDLALTTAQGKRVSVTSACLASGAPATTALRHIGELHRAGLIERQPDPDDARRTWLALTGAGVDALLGYLASVGGVR